MAINLRLTPQKPKPTFQTQNPVENMMRNPVEDFLAPFKQQKSELEQKLAEISSGQSPKSISQDINENNWSQFQGDDPGKPNYQPQSLIDYFRTGKTTSQLASEGAIPSTTVPDSQNPFKTPVKSSNPYEGAPGFVQGVGNFMFGTNPEDPTTSGLYKTAEAIQGAGQAIFENQVEGGKQIADLAMQHSQEALNRGYSDLSTEKEQKIKQYIREKLNAGVSPDIIKEALAKAKSEGKLQGSWIDNPISGTLATIESGLSKGIAGLETGISNLGSAPLQEDATAGVTRFAKGALETGLGSAQLATSVMPTTVGAKALIAPTVNTLFSTETAGKVLEPITEGISSGVALGQEALGFNPESSVSKDIQDIGGTAGTIALFGGAQKAGSKGYDYVAPKVEGAVKKGVQKVKDVSGKIKAPTIPKTSQENVTGVTEGGVEFTIEKTPGLGKNITDPLFKKPNEVLAQQSVFPKATKEKTIGMRKQASETALKGIKQLYEDKAKGNIESDIRTMGGGVEGVSEALQVHGKRIGELTEGKSIVDAGDIITPLKDSLSTPFSGVNPGMKNLVETIVKEFDAVGNKASISDIQTALSSIKSEIFANAENIAKLHKTPTGKALNDFLKNLEDRLNITIENTSGNSAELKSAKSQYSALKKIEKDLADSYMVELRNQGKGITGTAGKVAGLYEVLSNPSMSGILKAVALKQAGETMQYYKSRSGNYETLIRNLDREAMNRKPNPPKNDNNTSTTRGNMDNSQPLMLPEKTLTEPDAIVTPQTKEKAVIQESKQELKNAKIGGQYKNPIKIPNGEKISSRESDILNVYNKRTPYQMFDEINRAANDRRFSFDTIDGRIAEFKKATGKDPLDVSYSDFGSDGKLKEVSMSKSEGGNTAVIEKPKTQTSIETENITKKPVENLQKEKKSDTVSSETKKTNMDSLNEIIKGSKKVYDGSYDGLLTGKKLYRGGDENGRFWTDDKDIAQSFGDEGIIEKSISMENPLDVRNPQIKKYIKENSDINIDDATSAYSRSIPEFNKLIKWAEDNGFDGIIGKTTDNGLNFTGNEYIPTKLNDFYKKNSGMSEKPTTQKSILPKPKKAEQESLNIEEPKKPQSEMTVAEKIQAELDAKQQAKSFKDVNERVAGSRKEKAMYRKLSLEDYEKVESQSAALANDLVTRDRVIQDKYDPKVGKESGDGAGIAYLKDKILSSLTRKPEVGKEFRETFVKDVPELYQKIAEAKSIDEIRQIAKDTFTTRYSRKGDSVVFSDSSKPDAVGVLGKKFLDTITERTEGAKTAWAEAEMREGLTSEQLSQKKASYIEKKKEQLAKMQETFKTRDWNEKAKRMMPGSMDHYQYVLGEKFKASDYRNQSPEIVKKIADYLKNREEESLKTFMDWSIQEFDKNPKNQVRSHDWSYLADETKTSKSLLPKEKSDTPTLHGGDTIKDIYREGGRPVSPDEVSSPDKIQELYGYKSTQFGNYMKDADSIASVKNFIGAMKDLEDITGINIKELNKKEGLSIAFGARGQGRFAAHYEPSYNIINLTKGKGNGSVAHEFGHFLDYTAGNMLGLKQGGFVQALSKKPIVRKSSDMRFRFMESSTPELSPLENAMKDLLDTIKGEGKTHVKEVKFSPNPDSPTYPRIRDMFNEKGLDETIKFVNERGYKDSDKVKIFKYIAKLNGGDIKVPLIQKGTRFFSDSEGLGKYWGSNVELIARSFEAYIQDLGEEKGIRSNYLVAENNHPVESRKHGQLHIYPLGEERVMINKAFDKFMTVFKENIEKK